MITDVHRQMCSADATVCEIRCAPLPLPLPLPLPIGSGSGSGSGVLQHQGRGMSGLACQANQALRGDERVELMRIFLNA